VLADARLEWRHGRAARPPLGAGRSPPRTRTRTRTRTSARLIMPMPLPPQPEAVASWPSGPPLLPTTEERPNAPTSRPTPDRRGSGPEAAGQLPRGCRQVPGWCPAGSRASDKGNSAAAERRAGNMDHRLVTASLLAGSPPANGALSPRGAPCSKPPEPAASTRTAASRFDSSRKSPARQIESAQLQRPHRGLRFAPFKSAFKRAPAGHR
jgi:hypothetical protein